MTIVAQHGWGKSDKIERGVVDNSIQGVMMSPRDESPDRLRTFLSNMESNHPATVRLVDPQFHIGVVSPARPGNLVHYQHYVPRLTPFLFSPAQIQQFVGDTLDWQRTLAISTFVSPTVMVEDLGSQWAQIAMMLAQETLHQHDGTKPLLISLIIGEDALRQGGQVDGWLNSLTQLDVDGFYLVVRRSSEEYRQHYDPDVLSSLLRVCYSLAELNQYQLYVGYCDMVTPLLHATGVTGTAAGWFTGLKQFTLRRFQPTSGGRRPRSRYTSLPLLNSIYITELGGLFNAGIASHVLSNTPYDGRFNGTTNPENVVWPPDEAALHHWCVLNESVRMVAGNYVTARLDAASNAITQARTDYLLISPQTTFAPETGPTHLEQWLDALNAFRSYASV